MTPGYRAVSMLDTGVVSERDLLVREIDVVLMLKEILDRIDLPPDNQIPGSAEINGPSEPLMHWTIPGTEIIISRASDGPRAGQYLFSQETVARIPKFHAKVRNLPVKSGALAGIYEEFVHAPGLIVPVWVSRALPSWSRTVVFGETVWQWGFLVIVMGGAFFLVRALLRLGRWWDARYEGVNPLFQFGLIVGLGASLSISVIAVNLLLYAGRFFGWAWSIVSAGIWVLIFVGLGWLVVASGHWLGRAINAHRQVSESSIDGQLVLTMLKLATGAALVLVAVRATGFFGIPIEPVLAGLGIGGLAIALAVRPTLENIIAGLSLFLDKPVRVGDFCQFGESVAGNVEEIGLRSTRLRKFDDSIVSVPNSDFANRELTNFGRIRHRLFSTIVGLTFDTSQDQLRDVMDRIQQLLHSSPNVQQDWMEVRFKAIGQSSLDIEINAFLNTPSWDEMTNIRETLNFGILQAVEGAGVAFAFPTQSIHLEHGPDRPVGTTPHGVVD